MLKFEFLTTLVFKSSAYLITLITNEVITKGLRTCSVIFLKFQFRLPRSFALAVNSILFSHGGIRSDPPSDPYNVLT